MTADRREPLDQLYALLDGLDDRNGPPRLLDECGPQTGWPDAGIYFFYEEGEQRENGQPRVVRVGTHRLTATSRSTLWDRLAQHRGSPTGGNHRGSIFRLHVGTAMLASGEYPEAAATWGLKKPPPEARLQERRLEQAVSAHIGRMPFRHVTVHDRFARDVVETGAIALLSNFGRPHVDPASPTWLGHHADRADVRDSHLWNVRHVRDPWETTWLDLLASCVEGREHAIAAEQGPDFRPQPKARPQRARERQPHGSSAQEPFTPDLWSLLEAHLAVGITIRTLGQGNPNTVLELTPSGLVLQTERSANRGLEGELVPARMFNVAWERLLSHGRLSRDELLNDLNVKRSSAVFAVLATLPGVRHSGPPMMLNRDA